MSKSYKQRLDPEGEVEALAEGMHALSRWPFRQILEKAGTDPAVLEQPRHIRRSDVAVALRNGGSFGL